MDGWIEVVVLWMADEFLEKVFEFLAPLAIVLELLFELKEDGEVSIGLLKGLCDERDMIRAQSRLEDRKRL